nr:hypothetical protein [Pandoravirus massiliensis]
MATDETCQRFNKFLRQRSDGQHWFRGNLFDCYEGQTIDTQGRRVTAIEVDCNWRAGILNSVVIKESADVQGDSEFDLDLRCF